MSIESSVATILSVATFFTKLISKNKEYDFHFLEKILEENRWKTVHDYVLSSIFKVQRGRDYDASTIRYFLAKPDSMRWFNEFDKAERYIDVTTFIRDEKKEVESISLVKFLQNEDNFKAMIRNRTFFFGLFILIGCIPFIFMFNIKNISIIVIFLFMGMFFLGAYYMLGEIEALQSAKKMSQLEIT